jgi:3-hydroxyisobutyrate dehydrogenase-like beta-hydroxyacid dehydrogenase
MGSIFAIRLLDAGYPVGVWNRTAAKSEPLVKRGALVFSDPARLVEASDVLLVCMADEPALEDLFSGRNGLMSAAIAGKLIAVTSTVRPRFILDLSDRVIRKSGLLIDTPVLGTVGPAREGRIVVVAGGTAETVDYARPVFSTLSRKLIHVGAVGAGATMKLVVNMHLATYWHSLAESIAMGLRGGLDLEVMLAILGDSPVATAALKDKLPIILGKSSDVGFNIAGVHKDLAAAISLAEATGIEARTAMGARAGFESAIGAGWSGHDVAEIIRAVVEATVDGSEQTSAAPDRNRR